MQVALLILLAWFTTSSLPIELDDDVHESRESSFLLPIYPGTRGTDVLGVRLYYSEDRGKSWKLLKDLRKSGDVEFKASRDGLYWFAGQLVTAKGSQPAELINLQPAMKVYVNSAKRQVKIAPKSTVRLTREVKELRETVKELSLRIKELEETHREKK
jgi:hypothetical protein